MATLRQPRRARPNPRRARSLPKVPTGIAGLDELTGGGLPRGRVILVCGGTEAYIGPQGALTGSARLAREEEDQAAAPALRQEVDRLRRDLDRRHRAPNSHVAGLRAEAGLQESGVKRNLAEAQARLERVSTNRAAMTAARGDAGPSPTHRRRVQYAGTRNGHGNGHAPRGTAPGRGR